MDNIYHMSWDYDHGDFRTAAMARRSDEPKWSHCEFWTVSKLYGKLANVFRQTVRLWENSDGLASFDYFDHLFNFVDVYFDNNYGCVLATL
jgi:hypothetical protein